MKPVKTIYLITGCVFLFWVCMPPDAQARKLSDAMEEAADNHDSQEDDDASDNHHYHHYDDDDHHRHSHHSSSCLPFFFDLFSSPPNNVDPMQEEPEPYPEEGEPDEHIPEDLEKLPGAFSISAGSGFFKGDDFYPLAHMDLSMGAYFTKKTRPELYIGLGFADIDESELLDNAISGSVTFYSLGVRIKQYTTPLYHPVGHYFVGGLAYTSMNWKYNNEIFADGDTIQYDGIAGLEAFFGMGFHLAQTRNTQIGLEVLPTVIWWSDETNEGFDNDVFGDPLMLKLRLVFSWI